MNLEEVRTLRAGEGEEPAAPTPSRFLARQSIMNGRGEVVGYELLFREGWENSFDGKASETTLDRCLYMGIELLTNNSLAFVNCTRESIVHKLVTLLPAKTTVIELTEPGEVDAELIDACIGLRKMGYRLALDDFVARPELQPLVEIADYLKVDFSRSDAYTRRQTDRLARYSGVALVANKVEDRELFQIARSEGYQYFQGLFFCHPTVIANREIPTNRLIYLRLLAELNRTPLNLHDVAGIVQLEPSLCYRVLRLANSAMWARNGEVTSIQAAFLLVGEDRFRALVSVAASCALSQQQTPALISLSLERARFCELVAALAGEDPGEQFMIGLLSLLDAMLDMPMGSIVKTLPLRSEAKAALAGAINRVGAPLGLIRSLESGAWEKCAGAANILGIGEETLAGLYVESVKWATESIASLG